MIIEEGEFLTHYGTPRHSGRYPWGSGGDEGGSQRNKAFLDYVADLHRQGLSDVEIAKGLEMTTTELRAAKSIAKTAQKQAQIAMAQRLQDKGYSNVAIGRRMGLNESTVRSLLAPGQKDKLDVLQATASMLRDQVNKYEYIDVGSGVENHIGISQTKLSTALAVLKEEGYRVHTVQTPQMGTNKKTLVKVLTLPGREYRDVNANRDKIRIPNQKTIDGGRTYLGMKPPISISSKRVDVRWAEDGGTDADGVIYVRPGVKDVSLGGARYAQVRIAVDGTHYLKGMAIYKDDLPDGVDLVFNTNKKRSPNKLDAMKELKRTKDGKVDEDNPFGAAIDMTGQILDHNENVTSVMNKVNEEGTWETWSRTLSSQMLSKQSPRLAKEQLDMAYERRKNEFDEIMSLTNPAVRRKLLEAFADGSDSAAVHLKAAALPRQASHVILPVPSMKPTEVYAPNYNNGERVVLIRHPHGGTFEIPELVVNNRHPEAKKLLGGAKDAIGIHPKVAERLSGADFDGDTVLVIPNNHGKVKTSPPLAGLKDFDPKREYPPYDGMKTIDGGSYNAKTGKVDYPKGRTPSSRKGFEMGDVSNLITDMTIRGANPDEIAKAVRHSMVVIDSEKHHLDYKKSALDNGILGLKKKYQTYPGKTGLGASTLISRATSRKDVPLRKPTYRVDPVTGKKIYQETGDSYTDSRGKTVLRTQRSTKLAETNDAHTLSSGTVIEKIYADYSNKAKSLGDQARLALVHTKSTPHSSSAAKAYASEVASLDAKLNIALMNRPLERQAQILANTQLSARKAANPDMDDAEIKKLKSQLLTEMRRRTGAQKQQIQITDAEWDAIQAGAITNNKLTQILNNADLDRVKQLATPKTEVRMTATKRRRAESMLSLGYTQAEVASQLGVSVSTLKKSLAE